MFRTQSVRNDREYEHEHPCTYVNLLVFIFVYAISNIFEHSNDQMKNSKKMKYQIMCEIIGNANSNFIFGDALEGDI